MSTVSPLPSPREQGLPDAVSNAATWRTDLLPKIAAAGCALFGLLFMLNVHPVGDGLWFWYAVALRHGQKLYSDMHVPMQPLFIFATEWNQKVLGKSWLASKALAAVQDLLYCWGLYLVTKRVRWPAYQRALLIAAIFGMTIMAFYYRFDDYHITGHCLVVFSIYLCLRLQRSPSDKRTFQYAAALGVFAGLATANRLNDGALLGAASAVAIVTLVKRKQIAALTTFVAVATVTLAALVLATGDSLKSWSDETIFHAATIKGGTGRILFAPFHFPLKTWLHLTTDPVYLRNLLFASSVIVAIAAGMYLRRNATGRRSVSNLLLLGGGLGALYVVRQANSGISILSIADGMTLFCYAALALLAVRLVILAKNGELRRWNHYEVLFLFPFGQMFSGAMTSGQSFLEAYPALAMLLLVAPFVFPALSTSSILRNCFTTLLVLMAAGTLVSKWSHPYYWHHFNNGAMFTSRVWYDHPEFGPMYVERDHLALITSLCSTMHNNSTGNGELLAMPWPYPNYFCNVPPWHGYVQTWYDTTSASTIKKLTGELQDHPPEWIAYQRAPDSIRIHEVIFFGGSRLPHRALDDMITDRIRSGAWSLPWQRCFSGADWLLIHTRPATPGEANEMLIPSSDRINLCARTDHGFMR